MCICTLERGGFWFLGSERDRQRVGGGWECRLRAAYDRKDMVEIIVRVFGILTSTVCTAFCLFSSVFSVSLRFTSHNILPYSAIYCMM